MIDGNYTRAIPVKSAEIDTVIWLDFTVSSQPLPFCEACGSAGMGATGFMENWNNRESLLRMFGRDSIIWWMIKTHAKNRQKYLKMMQMPDINIYSGFVFFKDTKTGESFFRPVGC